MLCLTTVLRLSIVYIILTRCLCIWALGKLNFIIEADKEYAQEMSDKVHCVIELVNKNLPCGTIITAVTADVPFDNIIKAVNNENCHILITRSLQRQNWLIQTDVYLILLKNATELSFALFELSRDLLWNPGTKFVLVVDKTINDDVHKIFHELLKHRIYNVILLSSVNVNYEDTEIFAYFPFENNNCGKHFDTVVNLGYCHDVFNSSTLFHREDLNDYRKCTIVVGIHEVVPYVVTSETTDLIVSEEYKFGIEQLILESIAVLEDIKIEYTFFSSDITRGVVLSNSSGTGILGYLQSGEISLAVGGYILILNRVSICDYIWGYNYADLKIVTPATTEIVWKKVYREFGINSWILVLCSFCVMSIVTLLIVRFSLKRRHDSVSVILKLLDYLLDHSDESLFKTKNLRILLLCWIWYTYFINSFYKTAYYSLITGHVKERRGFEPHSLSTFPYKPCISDVGRSFFLYAYNLTFPYGKWIEKCQTTDGGLDYVVQNPDYYTVATEYAYFLKAPKYIDGDGNFELDSWDILSGTISAFYCTRGFELRKRFQKHAMHIFESGLLQFRLNMMNVKRRHFTQNNKRYFKSLIFSDFKVSYYILLVGIIISSLCFVFERCLRK